MQKIEFTEVIPEVPSIAGVENPTEVRYGWTPYKNIHLYNSDGTPAYYVQPANSPFHRELPKNRLIPFETFTKSMEKPLDSDSPGRVANYTETTTITAYDAVTELFPAYARQGYTMLRSLQGLAQADAFRIFQVVMPFDLKLGEILGELEFGSPERIEATAPTTYDIGEEFVIQPLANGHERELAERLRQEMIVAAEIAVKLASDILDDTEAQITAKFSGAKEGKAGGDPRDKYLFDQMGREEPRFLGRENKIDTLVRKVDYLAEREETRAATEKMERLERENAEMKAELATRNALPAIETGKIAVGDKVIVKDVEATVLHRPGGNVQVQYADGTKETVKPAEVTKL